jgi:hypothetical protein
MIVDLNSAEMNDAFVDWILGEMNVLVPLDGGPECCDMWHALCGA